MCTDDELIMIINEHTTWENEIADAFFDIRTVTWTISMRVEE